MNNKGFAISAVVYGLAIMGILIVAILMKTVSSTRENQKQLSEMIEKELNALGMSANSFYPLADGVGQSFTAQDDGLYRIELWGAAGNNGAGGKGAYTSGIIALKEGDSLYFYVGNSHAGTGGEETDVRVISNGGYDGHDSYETRIMVAGGGGVTGDARGIVRVDDLTLVSPKPSNTEAGDGYIPGTNSSEGGSSFISGFSGSQAIIQGKKPDVETPTYKYFPILNYESGVYTYVTDESKGKKYYFIDGIIIPGTNSGGGKALIKKISGTPEEIKIKTKYGSEELNKLQLKKISICKSSGTSFTSAEKDLIKIYVIGDITSVTETEDSGGINFATTNTLNGSCIENTLTTEGQNKKIDEIAILNLDKTKKYNIKVTAKSGSVFNVLEAARPNSSSEIRFSVYQPVGKIPKVGNYYIQSISSENKVLTADTGQIKPQLLSGNKNQVWEISNVADSKYKIIEMSKYNAMELNSESIVADAVEIECNNSYNTMSENRSQLFKITANTDGTFMITPYIDTGDNYALSATDSGLKVTTKNENDDSQKFKLIAIDFNDKEE
ncbi:MAG: hypothetical protein IJI22_03780 [Bacilli bacterium]|nr:hypothetical protein [Bacilli bacterium]